MVVIRTNHHRRTYHHHHHTYHHRIHPIHRIHLDSSKYCPHLCCICYSLPCSKAVLQLPYLHEAFSKRHTRYILRTRERSISLLFVSVRDRSDRPEVVRVKAFRPVPSEVDRVSKDLTRSPREVPDRSSFRTCDVTRVCSYPLIESPVLILSLIHI